MKKISALIAGLLVALHALAQGDAAATGGAIVEALNARDVDALMRVMDVDEVARLVTKDLGLSAADREKVRVSFPKALRNNLEIGVRTIEGSKGSAKFLRGGKRDARPYTLVRYDLGDQGIDYVEYYLTASGKVDDWYVHSLATLYSTSAALGLATIFKTDSMLFGILGMRASTEADTKPFTELRARLQKQDFAGAHKALDAFPEGFRKTRQWALMRVTYGARIDDAAHRAALRYLAQNFGEDPALQFMLIDHYAFEKQFDRALTALAALERAIGGEDAATANLRGRILVPAKRYEEAARACRRGMALEPDHKPAYWCLVEVGLDANNGKVAIEGLSAYEKAFKVQFDPAKLAGLDAYKAIAKTPEFAAWAKRRKK
jgi:hypothetical protein